MTLIVRAMIALFLTLASAHAREGWWSVFPGGIHYAVERNSLDPDRWRDELHHTDDCRSPCLVKFDERISALHLRYKWAQLNPAPGVYDFSDLGAVIDDANANHKMVTLVIMAGKYTPEWLISRGVGHISTPAKSSDEYSQPWVPTPWDPALLSAYGDMLDALSSFLRETPSRYEAVVLVKNGIAVVHSAEMRLMPPDAFDIPGLEKGFQKRDIGRRNGFFRFICEDWANSGYSERKLIGAVDEINSRIALAFPDQYIGLAFVAGSVQFPSVGSRGNCTYPDKNETSSKIIKRMIRTYGQRAIINSTVLTDVSGTPPILSWVRDHGGQVAYQLNRQVIGCKQGAPYSCDDELMLNSLRSGIENGATFIEIHEGNINRHLEILRVVNSELSRKTP